MGTDQPTDRPTNRRTDKAGYRVACTRLKIALLSNKRRIELTGIMVPSKNDERGSTFISGEKINEKCYKMIEKQIWF